MDSRNDVGSKDIRVDKVLLTLEMLDDFKVGESPGMPSLVPLGIELGSLLVRLEDVDWLILA
jgi:hypothetical protein